MQTVYEAAGGRDGLLRLASAWHARVLEDDVVSHAFSHGYHPQHTERLAAYWAEALGGPTTYSDRYGDETSVVRIHSGNGPHEEMDQRAIACFDQALEDVGLARDERLRRVLHDYFAWATTTTMARYHHSAEDVPDGLHIPNGRGTDSSVEERPTAQGPAARGTDATERAGRAATYTACTMTTATVDRPSVCPLDCPDTCSLTVTVQADRIVKIRGSHANPYTAGVLCAKVPAMYPEFVHGPGRLTTPLRRTGAKGEGRFERISWDDALDIVHARFTAVMAEHGPQAIMPLNYGGPHGLLAGGSMDLRFFHRLGATLLDRGPLCGGIRTEAWNGTFGAAPGIPPEQVEHSRLIVAWGNNVTWSNLHLTPLIDRARRAGAKLVVVDPRRTKIAERADLHLPIRPGTDVVLAWAIAADLERTGGLDRAFIERHVAGFEEFMARARPWTLEGAARECALPEAAVRRFAEWFRTISPAAISVGNGLERNQNGGSGIRAVFALPALAGKLGVAGGGLVNSARAAFPRTPAKLARPDLVPTGTRTLNIVDVGRHLTDPALAPPLRALFVYNHNPLVVHPDQNRMRRGLAREDLFIVGCDVVMTDTLAYADVVLPACSHFEHDDIYAAYGQHWLQRAEPVIPPQGEALPNTEIFRRLAARFGFTEPAFKASDAELIDDALDGNDPRLGGVRPSRLPVGTALPMRFDGAEANLFANVLPKTASGKVELASTYLEQRYGARLPDYRPFRNAWPLILITPASDQRITSTFGGVRGNEETPPLEMHPDDATARGLRDGMRVRVHNDLGEVHLPLRVTDAVPRGVVCSLKGAWMRTSDNGQTVSALAPAHHADLAGGACYNDARVEVSAA